MKVIGHVSGKHDRIPVSRGFGAAVFTFIIILSTLSAMGGFQESNEGSAPISLGDTPLEISPEVEQKLSSMAGWFTKNQGQIENSEVKYVYSASDMSLEFIESGYLIALTNEENLTTVVNVTFGGANRVVPEGRGELSHRSNYFVGNDSRNWRSGVRNFEEVVYGNLYNGIDLKFYCDEEGLKYDFVVQPRADPNKISMEYQGANTLDISNDGSLLIQTQHGVLEDKPPYSYQKMDDQEIRVTSNYRILGMTVGFDLGEYDRSSILIIDPILYSTFIGGSGSENARRIAIDDDDFVYVASHTHSLDFPTTSACYDDSKNNGTDTVVYKFNADLKSLEYSTYLGGHGTDRVRGMCIDSQGCAYITGWMNSDDYPTTPGCFDDTKNGNWDGVVAKLSADGSELIYSTYIGGGGSDRTRGIDVDSEGFAYATGLTDSEDFPTTPGCFKDTKVEGTMQAFVLQLNQDGTDVIYSTYLGGTDSNGYDLVVDSEENVYISGDTATADFPTTPGCYDNTFNGATDIFLCKMRLKGQGFLDLIYSTYIGGAGLESYPGITIDDTNDVYMTGATTSADFPTTILCYDPTINGFQDVFVLKLSMDNLGPLDLRYSTFIGGIFGDFSYGIAVDTNGNACIAGSTYSPDFPTTTGCYDGIGCNDYDPDTRNYNNPIVCKLNSDGSELLYSSYIIGEITNGVAWGIVVDSKDFTYLTGFLYNETHNNDFPVTPDCFDNIRNSSDLFFVQMELSARNIPPTVYEITPNNDTKVSGTTTIAGKGWDPNNPKKIRYVQISIDNGRWKTVNGTAVWNYEWDTTSFDDGEHILRIRAFDGEYYSDTQEVILDVDNESSNLLFLIIIGISGTSIVLYLLFTNENTKYGLFLSIPLYTRLKKDDLLDQPKRKIIYNYIILNPGVNLTTIFKELDLGYGTLVHHLNMLEKEGLIVSSKEMGIKRFNSRKSENEFSDTNSDSHISPIQQEILDYLKEHDSTPRKDIEEELEIKSSTLIYSLRRLREWGLIERKGSRKHAEYSLVYEDW